MVSIPNKVMKMISKVLIHDTVFPILYQTKDRTKTLNAATAKAAVNAICNSPIASESINGTHPMNYDMTRAAQCGCVSTICCLHIYVTSYVYLDEVPKTSVSSPSFFFLSVASLVSDILLKRRGLFSVAHIYLFIESIPTNEVENVA